MPEPQDFALQPFEGKARPAEPPRMLDEEGLDDAYPTVGAPSSVAEAEGGRRKKRNTARLVWDSKPKRAPNPKNLGFQIAEVVVPNPAQAGPRLPFDPVAGEVDTSSCNRLIWGDNLLVMQALLAQGYEGKINLIYIDPPFDSKADYSHSVQLTPDEAGKGGGELTAEMSALERLAYRDTWEDGTDSYLDMLYPRLQLMYRLLAEDGSILVHCDWHANSHIRLLLNEIFGIKNHINQIAWCYGGGGAPSNYYQQKTDTIFWYGKSNKWKFNKQYRPYSEGTFRTGFNAKGMENSLNPEGAGLTDWWADCPKILSFNAYENAAFSTQKPKSLMDRLIVGHSDEGDLIADFFSGSGSTVVAAERLNRRWVGSDLSKSALQITRNRLVRLAMEGSGDVPAESPCSPFVVENLGNYQRQLIYLNDHKLKQVGPLVLTLFGALPHPSERSLGTQTANDPVTGRLQRRLVLVGDPDRPLSARRVAEAVRLLNSLDGGGYARLVALGWDFELNFDAGLQRLLGADITKVEARIVPTDVIEFLKKIPEGAGPDNVEVERLRDKVAFFEKPWLEAPTFTVQGWLEQDGQRQLKVTLKLGRYLLRSVPSGLKDFAKMSESEKVEWLRKAGGADGLNLIDFWCVDDDLGGADGKRPFTSTQQDLRGLGKRVRRIVSEMELVYTPRPGRQVGLRMVDVFGNDAAWRGILPEG